MRFQYFFPETCCLITCVAFFRFAIFSWFPKKLQLDFVVGHVSKFRYLQVGGMWDVEIILQNFPQILIGLDFDQSMKDNCKFCEAFFALSTLIAGVTLKPTMTFFEKAFNIKRL